MNAPAFSIAATSLLLAACGAWQITTLGPADTIPVRQQAQLFLHDGRVLTWHALRVSPDSLSGVPYVQAPACDSCRAAVPRAEVDSVRFGDHEAAGVLIGAAPFLALAAIVVVLQLGSGD